MTQKLFQQKLDYDFKITLENILSTLDKRSLLPYESSRISQTWKKTGRTTTFENMKPFLNYLSSISQTTIQKAHSKHLLHIAHDWKTIQHNLNNSSFSNTPLFKAILLEHIRNNLESMEQFQAHLKSLNSILEKKSTQQSFAMLSDDIKACENRINELSYCDFQSVFNHEIMKHTKSKTLNRFLKAHYSKLPGNILTHNKRKFPLRFYAKSNEAFLYGLLTNAAYFMQQKQTQPPKHSAAINDILESLGIDHNATCSPCTQPYPSLSIWLLGVSAASCLTLSILSISTVLNLSITAQICLWTGFSLSAGFGLLTHLIQSMNEAPPTTMPPNTTHNNETSDNLKAHDLKDVQLDSPKSSVRKTQICQRDFRNP